MSVQVAKAITAIYLLLTSLSAMAAKTYTPDELRALVNAGNPPAQGAASSQSQSVPFPACVARAKSVVDSVGAQYPTRVVADTSLLFTVKIWTNDSAMTLNCSDPDQKLIITTAKYL